ncbi:MAG: histidine--tRNA ligase [bacterium]
MSEAKKTIERVRGTRDILPGEYARRRHAWEKIREVFERFGYRGVELPTIEPVELHLMKSGEDIVKHLYSFEDQSGEKICLRPEFTASVVRMFISELQNEPLPIRLFYLGSTFRYDRPQMGRYREFTQAGVELIGGSTPEYDAEVLAITCRVMDALEFQNYELVIGNIGITLKFLSQKRLEEDVKKYLLENLESLNKAGDKDGYIAKIKEGLKERGLPCGKATDEALEFIRKLIAIKGLPPGVFDEVDVLLKAYNVSDAPLNELRAIADYLNYYEVDWTKARIDFGFGRGLMYYTGMIFEIYCYTDRLGESQKQVCGGGRYDTLIGALGCSRDVPSAGFSFGLDRLLLAMGEVSEAPAFLDAFVAPIGGEAEFQHAIYVANRLREKGLRAEIGPKGGSPRELTGMANRLGARFVLYIGEAELAEKVVALRDMKMKEQKKCPLEEAIGIINSKRYRTTDEHG